MALKEIMALFRGLLPTGDEALLYPVTKIACVDGLREEIDARKPIYFDITIGTGWAGSAAPYSQNITVTGILAADKPVMHLRKADDLAAAKQQQEAFDKLHKIKTSANRVTVSAEEKTTVAIPVTLEVHR